MDKVKNKDLIVDLKVNSKDLFRKIDPTIRVKLVRRGLNILRNRYTGFDSEYKYLEDNINKLISIQIATCGRIILKFPLIKSYEFSSLDTFNDRIYKNEKSSSYINYDEILNKINESIRVYRRIKYF